MTWLDKLKLKYMGDEQMSFTNKLLCYAGKKDFQIDKRISVGYFIRLCWKYGWMKVRGSLYSFGNKKIQKGLFMGKAVSIVEKKYLTIGSCVKLHDGVYIDALSIDGVHIGNDVILGRNSRIECTGSLSSIGKGISIGNRTTFGNDCFFGAAGGIQIGEDVVAGQYIRFHSENHNFEDTTRLIREQGVSHKGIIIGDNCWIGSGAVFLDGSEIGDGVVVAAGAVVTRKFPSNVVIGGIPAKILKSREKKE